MSMEKKLNKFLDELIQEVETELDEATASANVAGYNTPAAFSDGGSKDKKRKKKISTQFGMKIVGKMDEDLNEATFRPNSGTMSGGTYGLDKRKYELKRDVKGVKIGDYTNVTLPKGTIIYNLPGGVFAHHRSLKSYEAGMNKYFNKPTFRGISIRREKNVILSIEKNSKILESVNEGISKDHIKIEKSMTGFYNILVWNKGWQLFSKHRFEGMGKEVMKAMNSRKGMKYVEKLINKQNQKSSSEIIANNSEKNGIARLIGESVNEGNIKLSSSAKKFWNTSSKKLFGFSGSNPYDNVPPSQWNTHPEIIDGYGKNAGADIFKKFIRDKMNGNGYLDSKVAKMTGLPTNVSIIDYLNDGGSGLNGNKNFKRFKTWFAALYDIYEEMEKKFGKVKVESVNEARLNVRDLPSDVLSGPGDFEDWYEEGMEIRGKKKLAPMSKSDERKLFNLVEMWIESRDDRRYGSGSQDDIDDIIKSIAKFLTQKGKVVKESVNEAKVKRPVNRWLELKNDETMHPHKKMAMGLKELKYQLRETEKFFNWYGKIKSMNELDSSDYWKRTNKHIYKIKERLINIAKTIQEIEK